MKRMEQSLPAVLMMLLARCRLTGLLVLGLLATPLAAQTNVTAFGFPDRGGVSMTTPGLSPTLSVGYSQITANGAVPAGFAIFDFRQNNILVSEATVPAASLTSEGRIYAEIGGGLDTGIAIANPNAVAIQVAYYFTDTLGVNSGSNVLTIPAGGQLARFLTEAPFDAPSHFLGTFTFFLLRLHPDLTVAAIALRGFTNERGEFLITTLPITPLGQRGLFSGSVLPHFASGGGWAIQVILVNPTDDEQAGVVVFTDQAGRPATVDTDDGSGSIFAYHLAPASSWTVRTRSGGALGLGSARIVSTGVTADIPIGFLTFSYHSGGVTVSEAGVPPSRPTNAARLFVEASGDFLGARKGSLQTGIAMSNAGSMESVRVSYDLTTLEGVATGLHGEIDIPAGGQTSAFFSEMPGLQSMPESFQGVLRVSAPNGPIAIAGLRGRYNERGEFLVTTQPTVNENDPQFNLNLQYSSFVFPHFADGGGYTTQFVLFSGWTTGSTSGTLQFFNNAGVPFPLLRLNQ